MPDPGRGFGQRPRPAGERLDGIELRLLVGEIIPERLPVHAGGRKARAVHKSRQLLPGDFPAFVIAPVTAVFLNKVFEHDAFPLFGSLAISLSEIRPCVKFGFFENKDKNAQIILAIFYIK